MRTPKGREILKEYLNEGCILLGGIRNIVMLKNFKKAFFRALCLGALCLLGEWCSNLGRL